MKENDNRISKIDSIRDTLYQIRFIDNEIEINKILNKSIGDIKEINLAMPRPKIICLIGSSRFADLEAVMKWEFEKQGYICVGMHLLPDWYFEAKAIDATGGHLAEKEDCAHIMDELHLRKIDLADKVFCINHGGYIGERTRFEINYAKENGKPVKYLEPIE
jgi:hypothetical protein